MQNVEMQIANARPQGIMSSIKRRPVDSWRAFLVRTVAAQLHFLGLLCALSGLLILLPKVAVHTQGDSAHLVANSAFMLAGALVFLVSSLYHFLHDGYLISDDLAHRFETLDQISIYIFIAASYTVFFLNTLAEPWCARLITFIWIVALCGCLYTVMRARLPQWAQSRVLYTSLFVLMGWTILVRVGEAFAAMRLQQILLFLAGGVAYSLGALVYGLRRPNLVRGLFGYHELWHLAVMLGFMLHFLLMLSFYRSI